MIEFIKELHFFSSLDAEKLQRLLLSTKIKPYKAMEILTYEEDDIDRVFFLLSGEAKLYKVDRYDNEIFLYTLSSHDLLTNIGSLDDDQVSCFSNVEFLMDSSVISFDMHDFKDIVKSENRLLQNLVNVLAKQKQMLDCMVNMGMVFDGTAKVANMIYSHLELFNSLKKQEIAYRLNIQPATLSRILAKLIRQGILCEEHNTISICNKENLYELFHA